MRSLCGHPSTGWCGNGKHSVAGTGTDRADREERGSHVTYLPRPRRSRPLSLPLPLEFPRFPELPGRPPEGCRATFACAPFPRPRPVVREAGCGGPPLSFFSSSDMPLRERPQSTDADAWRWDNCKRWCGATKHTLRRSPAWLDAAGVEWVQCVERGEGAASCTRRECSGGGSKRNGFIARDVCVCMCVYV